MLLKKIKFIRMSKKLLAAETSVEEEVMAPRLSSKNLRGSVLEICKRIAGSHKSQIISACFYGPRVCGYADEKSDVNVFLVLDNFRSRPRSYLKPLNGIKAFILAVDQGAFEGDVKQGLLGEFTAEKITVPYEPLINEEYLQRQEVKAKKRIVWELLENIVLEFPELSRELLIQAEYFMYEAMMRRARLFLPVTYSFLNMLRRDVRRKNVESMMRGYSKALDELAKEDQITFSNGHIKITNNLINTVRGRKFRLPLFLKSFQRAALLHILSVLPKMMRPLAYDEEVFMRSNRGIQAEELVFQLEDPKKYLLIPTPFGFAALSDKTGIEDFVRKAVPAGEVLDMRIEEVGGVLNAVYLLTFQRNREEQKVIVKKFKDWYGFKWFPLALWALGTKTFAVMGRSRLEREYAVNQFLHNQGFPVPTILYFSPRQSLIFKDFIEGEKLTKIIKRIISCKKEEVTEEAALVREVGKKIAEAHRLGVTLGDCKPENIIVTKDGKTFFVDLEQATRDGNGNQAWDVAEFLYYSGHYVSPVSPANAAVLIAKEFVIGYLEAGGKRETVRKAGSARYTKVFSIFTPPQVLLAVSNICKKTSKE
jgi:tRNA A-37 threonylcarbamoyl transferase component Bud32